ncbi:NADP-specific glutamate dehydrogenase [Jeotgalibaca sp. MA1X17-3]|uniref:NADP-specific glutamate dehydrogenase n=1 Tax=Jeotgalibaca sp. MA1X17-3 TaxID=2908211 RepID=UPI001F3C5A84|nr:NADP-specific glutamate dehydrogenase [Jeotgalibaca sp. MA1X17-3]UJF14980.1 NADP-specific glutamate dehydrogenase [Jeotgalibaca sp. MA1X17-3]
MMSSIEYIESVYQKLEKRDSHQKEFLQAIKEFFNTIQPAIEKNPEIIKWNLLEQIVEPERIFSFRVPWLDDQQNVQVNKGFRVQFNSAMGPYKGGLRFHPTVNESILKFLGFEQTFKNSLTGLPIGGGKGGADFDPKGKSETEIMRFCQSYMTELQKYIGPATDIPAGDIGVGKREIGYLYGQYKRLNGAHSGVLTGKPILLNGSLARTEATGYGLIYYTEEMLQANGKSFQGQQVVISGSGNVAIYAAMKAQEYGATVVAVSDSNGYIYDSNGIDLLLLKEIKEVRRGRLTEYAKEKELSTYQEGSVWDLETAYDIALPCATQNEIDRYQAATLIKNGVYCVSEGANMPSSIEAIELYQENNLLYGPSKAANAGGVATSTLEMAQNAQHSHWSFEQVDVELKKIMINIFKQVEDTCVEYDLGRNYLAGVNIHSFLTVAEAMISQGVV